MGRLEKKGELRNETWVEIYKKIERGITTFNLPCNTSNKRIHF